MKQRVICRKNSPPQARLPWGLSAPARKMVGVLEQVVCECHRLRPRLFPENRLFGYTPEIVVRENSESREVQAVSQAPYDLCCNLPEPLLACLIRQYHAEENCPLAAPVLPNLVTDMDYIRC